MTLERIFREAVFLHLYPRLEISVHLQIVQADGGVLPALVNATTIALAD